MSSSQLEAAATSQFGDSGVPITILKVFPQKISYTVPSFPVIAVQLKRIKYQVDDGSGAGTFDGFIREDPILKRTYPVTATIEQWPDAFFVQEEEFNRSIDVTGLTLSAHQVYVIWKWKWLDTSSDSSSSPCEMSQESEVDASDSNDEVSCMTQDSLVFKCMGTTKESRYQDTLCKASQMLDEGKNVPVRLRPEPDNPKDASAIAFDCKPEVKWEVIGYVTRDALKPVHDALNNNLIVEVKFKWIKYITHWSKSGLGWYTGITITRNGKWPPEAVRCRSTSFH